MLKTGFSVNIAFIFAAGSINWYQHKANTAGVNFEPFTGNKLVECCFIK